MHKEILTPEQTLLLPLLKQFSRKFYLVGGTAIALHIGHRRSIDFDLFTEKMFDNRQIQRRVARAHKIDKVARDEAGQFTVVLRGVHMTFFQYPFAVHAEQLFDHLIKVPDLLTLAAMKGYALGRRAKWKDYVDLYFIIRKYHGIAAIVRKAREIFGNEFNERLFREQLSYFKDMDYREEVVYMSGFAVKDKEVKKELTEFSMQE